MHPWRNIWHRRFIEGANLIDRYTLLVSRDRHASMDACVDQESIREEYVCLSGPLELLAQLGNL